ncbi:MAG: tRNA preQ1(34) S-adenosylmethionine ribosyltransferase-isomerase QueA [Hyphomicrobiaceae bacterium]
MRTELFDFTLPEDLIALEPTRERDGARLLVVAPGETPELADRRVRELPELLRPGDVLVLNDTRVVAAELAGRRQRGEHVAAVSFNLLAPVDESRWRALARPAKRLQAGDRLVFGSESDVCFAGHLEATVEMRGAGGEVVLAFDRHGAYLDEAIAALGQVPLPPYIASRRPLRPEDRERYQTIYARREGAVAAPTAGLHFTPALFEALTRRGVAAEHVTLHVGGGTFLPVKAEDTADHVIHGEWGEIDAATAERLNRVKAAGGRIVAVGSTALRLLETASDDTGVIHPFVGETALFITPGYRFKTVDVLMTNFHLPRSTLFMLVAAFAGLEVMRRAYAHAIAERYRFYSYGDATLLFRTRMPA